jgi:YggT family protein
MLIFGRVIMSWIPVDPNNPIVETLIQVTDPYLDLFRRIIPPIGMIDFSPMIAILVLQGIGRIFVSGV